MLKTRIIHWLGGYTEKEWRRYVDDRDFTNESLRETIRELQALIPVSAVLPKKKGRPRKV